MYSFIFIGGQRFGHKCYVRIAAHLGVAISKMEVRMSWTSKTQQFYPKEMEQLESQPANLLAARFLNSTPVIALRGVTEVLLNGDEVKLALLLANERLTLFWQDYQNDAYVRNFDHGYAEQLRAKLPKTE